MAWALWLAGKYFWVRRWGCCGSRAAGMLQPSLGWGPGPGERQLPLQGDGGSTPAHFTRGQNSRLFPWKYIGDVCLRSGRGGGWSRASPALGASGDQPTGNRTRALCLGTLPGVWGGSASSFWGRRYRPAGPGMRGGSGELRRLGTARGSPARFPGATGPKRRRAAGAEGVEAADFVVMCSGPGAPRFTPKTRAGSGAVRDRARGCAPFVGHRRGHFCRFRSFFSLAGGRYPGLLLPGPGGAGS